MHSHSLCRTGQLMTSSFIHIVLYFFASHRMQYIAGYAEGTREPNFKTVRYY